MLQDFRDVEGDLLQGRKTLPILYGYKSRVAVAGIIAMFGAAAPALLFVNSSAAALVTVATFVVMHGIIFTLLLKNGGKKMDHVAYRLQEVAWCLVCASSVLWA